MKLRFIFICALILLVSCQPGTGEFFVDSDDGADPPITTSDLLVRIQDTIFTPVCSGCHSGSQAPQGLRLENTDVSFEFLVNVTAIGNADFSRVVPDDADNSFLVLKIEGDPRAGQRMPLGSAPLSTQQIQLIRNWIDQGALPASDSPVITKVSAIIDISPELSDGRIAQRRFNIFFSQPIDTTSISKDSVLLYSDWDGESILLPQSDYFLEVASTRNVILTLTNIQSTGAKLSLVIDDSIGGGIIDHRGRVIDGDNNQTAGGRYEFIL